MELFQYLNKQCNTPERSDLILALLRETLKKKNNPPDTCSEGFDEAGIE